jgi:hypothetical protein
MATTPRMRPARPFTQAANAVSNCLGSSRASVRFKVCAGAIPCLNGEMRLSQSSSSTPTSSISSKSSTRHSTPTSTVSRISSSG